MSFAGPYDPMLALALKNAYAKGAILIAAVGNQGPKSPPLYPAADAHVIGVTAIDENDKLYKGSNIGQQVAIAAPGVDVMVPAPAESYQITTGTSVAASCQRRRHCAGTHPMPIHSLLECCSRARHASGEQARRQGRLGYRSARSLTSSMPACGCQFPNTPAPAATQAAAPRARAVAPHPRPSDRPRALPASSAQSMRQKPKPARPAPMHSLRQLMLCRWPNSVSAEILEALKT